MFSLDNPYTKIALKCKNAVSSQKPTKLSRKAKLQREKCKYLLLCSTECSSTSCTPSEFWPVHPEKALKYTLSFYKLWKHCRTVRLLLKTCKRKQQRSNKKKFEKTSCEVNSFPKKRKKQQTTGNRIKKKVHLNHFFILFACSILSDFLEQTTEKLAKTFEKKFGINWKI